MEPRPLSRKPPLVASDGIQPTALSFPFSRCSDTELNDSFPWDDFDSSYYYDHNYKVLRDDDRQIVEVVRDFFATLYPLSYKCGIDPHGRSPDPPDRTDRTVGMTDSPLRTGYSGMILVTGAVARRTVRQVGCS
jgi:hypothetical protein